MGAGLNFINDRLRLLPFRPIRATRPKRWRMKVQLRARYIPATYHQLADMEIERERR